MVKSFNRRCDIVASQVHEKQREEQLRNPTDYVPTWPDGTRVRLSNKDHPKMGQYATIVVALINPSKRREHQWYDVRFDDGVYGRFLERHLERIPQVSETRVA